MATVNIFGRLRFATEQIRRVQKNFIERHEEKNEDIEILDNVVKELDGILYNLVDVLSDENRLSEINVSSNDGEISKWLEETFSSKPSRTVPTSNRFESIKAIIQASSFVNALQRQLRQHTRERNAQQWNFSVDIHQLNQWTFPMMDYSDPMIFTLLLIFDAHDIISRYRIDSEILMNFSRALTDGYRKFRPAYHNEYHGADVLQTTHCLVIKSHLTTMFAQLDIAALLFAAAIHDYEHPGLNNNYLVKTRSDLALIYNDASVLENHHSSSIFILLRDAKVNIWSNMSTEEYRTFRSLVISLVLSTDMANHASLIERMSTYFFFKETNSINTIDPKLLLQIVLHAADISNAAKPWPIYIQSAEKVLEEFFLQGDLEKLHYDDHKSTFDRETTNISQLQIGFITHIVNPTFDILSKIFQMDSFDHQKKTSSTMNLPWQIDLQLNLETWKQIANETTMNTDQILLQKKPLKFRLDYLQMFFDKAKIAMKRRCQQDILLRNQSFSL